MGLRIQALVEFELKVKGIPRGHLEGERWGELSMGIEIFFGLTDDLPAPW
jgi:hypothetical protein